MDISRRQLAGVLIASTAAAQAQAQTPPATAAPSATPADDADLEAARGERLIAAQIIARVPLPMTAEPAFQFKA